jgi:hypothetical protein
MQRICVAVDWQLGRLRRMSRFVLGCGLSIGVALGACVNVPDPNHCWNLERDASCRHWGPNAVCSPCLRSYQGCVNAEDAPDCEEDGSDEGSSSGSEGP